VAGAERRHFPAAQTSCFGASESQYLLTAVFGMAVRYTGRRLLQTLNFGRLSFPAMFPGTVKSARRLERRADAYYEFGSTSLQRPIKSNWPFDIGVCFRVATPNKLLFLVQLRHGLTKGATTSESECLVCDEAPAGGFGFPQEACAVVRP
jgi:hypothetical protein